MDLFRTFHRLLHINSGFYVCAAPDKGRDGRGFLYLNIKHERIMDWILAIAAILEALTGLALFIDPSIVSELLLGSEIAGVGAMVGRVAGASLMSLALACWPGVLFKNLSKGLMAMLLYGLLITFYLGYLGIVEQSRGPLLFPAVLVHAGITCLLICQASTLYKTK
jgi:hypothetical protein